jgi:MFS family permease
MRSVVAAIFSLLLSAGIILLGNGLQGTLLPVRAKHEGFFPLEIGLIGAAYYLGFIFGCQGVPYLIKRVGHIRTFAALAALAAVAPLLHALFIHPWVWYGLRAITGFCFAGLYTVIESWLNERAQNEMRGRILSLYIVVNLSGILGGQLLFGLDPRGGWELFSLVAILIALSLLPVALTTAPMPAPLLSVRLRPLRLYRRSPVGFIGCVVVGFTNGAFWTLAPVYVVDSGLGEAMVATFMAVTVAAGALGQWPLGRLSDRFDRRLVIVAACFGAALGGVVLALLPGQVLTLIGAALFGAAGLSMYALFVAHANDFTPPGETVEVSASLLLTYALGAVMGPIAASYATTWLGPGALYYTTAVANLLLAFFVLYRMTRRAAPPLEARESFKMMEPRTGPAVFELDPRQGGHPAATKPGE